MNSREFTYFHEAEFAPPLRANILRAVCEKMGLRLESVQPREGFFFRIWDGDNFVNHQTNVFTVNSFGAARIARDKAYSYLLLQRAGIRVPRGDYYFRADYFGEPDFSTGRGKREAIRDGLMLGMRWTREEADHHLLNGNSDVILEWPLIVKPNGLSLGKGLSLITQSSQIETAIDKVFRLPNDLETIVIIQEYVEGEEFRVIMLDGELLLCYEKQVVSTQPVKIKPIDRTRDIPNDFVEMGRLISKEIQLRYCAIDLRCKSLTQPANEAVVLEVNGNPGLNYYFSDGDPEKVLQIYQRVLAVMLEESKALAVRFE